MEALLERNPGAFQPRYIDTPSPSIALASVSALSLNTPTQLEKTKGLIPAGSSNSTPVEPRSTPGSGGAVIVFHSKGCHCKKSNCLKKYCECFQAGFKCGDNCKCVNCKNGVESSLPKPSGSSSKLKKPVSTYSCMYGYTTAIADTTVYSRMSYSTLYR